MKLISIIIAAILGLTYGQYDYGFIFSQKICLFAGLTLVMPTLFNVKLSDIKLVFEYKTLMLKAMLVNYIALPLIALGIGLLTDSFGIAAGLFLLSVLSGGGMVMHWIKNSSSDTSIGFILLFINIVLVTLSLLMLHTFCI
jgi:ACR3 family arsenite efflux pump ArsB